MVLATFVDFTNAFGFINNELLTKKLELHETCGNALSLMRFYLAHCTQFVHLKVFYSTDKFVKKGGRAIGKYLGSPIIQPLY